MLCYIFLGVWLFCTLFSIHLGHRFSRFHFPMIFTILVSNVIYERGSCVYRHQHKYRLVGQFFITSSLKCVAHFSFKSLRHFFLCFVCVFFCSVTFFSAWMFVSFWIHFLRAPTEWNAFQAEKMFIHLIDASAYMAIVLTFDCVPVEKLLMCVKVLS